MGGEHGMDLFLRSPCRGLDWVHPPDGASSWMWQILFYILLLLSLIFAGIGLLAKRGLGEHRGE